VEPLRTDRLILRPLQPADAPRLAELAADFDIAAGTATLPHPYSLADAEQFIAHVRNDGPNSPNHVFAIVPNDAGQLAGIIGLHEQRDYRRAEMGYWVGKPYWNRGYASEAARRLVRFGFEALGLNRVHAACYASNVGSARVMQKAGLTYEGTLRQHYIRFGVVHDAHIYGILRSEWEQQQNQT
jgi:ribosomal-protein-alanine N-acetyltransferase